MSPEHLWDPAAEPDAEVRELERVLARYRFTAPSEPAWSRPPARRWPWICAAAAAVVAASFVLVRVFGTEEPAYRVSGLAGRERVRAGEHVDTAPGARARIEIGALGHVDVDGDTRVRVEDCGRDGHHLYLERGRVRATIFAAPRVFQIATPAGRTIDLGCAYELEVDDAGAASVRVTSGQIEFVVDGQELYLPAGARCDAQPGAAAPWPTFESISGALHDVVAIASGEKRMQSNGQESEILDRLLRDCTAADTLTLWHVFASTRAEAWIRERVRVRLASEFPLPPDVDEADVIAGDRSALRAWRATLVPSWRAQTFDGGAGR